MPNIEFEDGAVQIDAAIVGEGLGIEPSLVQQRMREGKITGLCERGVDEDHGRYRLSFSSEDRSFRLVVDEAGNVLQRSSLDSSARPVPTPARKPGP